MSTITTNTRNVRGVCERTEAPHSDDLHCTRRMSSDGQLPPDQHTGQDKPGITPVFNPSLEAGVIILCLYSPCSIQYSQWKNHLLKGNLPHGGLCKI